MIVQKHYVLCALFALLLTIVLYGIGKVVVKMAFGQESKDKEKIVEENKKKVTISMYVPQMIMLLIVFILGVYVPPVLNRVITLAAAGF